MKQRKSSLIGAMTVLLCVACIFPAQANCNTSQAYLSARLPYFSDPNLSNVRTSILNGNARDMLAAAKAQGLSPEAAIAQTKAQADSYLAILHQSTACAAQTSSFDGSDNELRNAMKSGRISSDLQCSGVADSCLCNAIAMRMGVIAMRAATADMLCLAKEGDSPQSIGNTSSGHAQSTPNYNPSRNANEPEVGSPQYCASHPYSFYCPKPCGNSCQSQLQSGAIETGDPSAAVAAPAVTNTNHPYRSGGAR